MTGALLQIGMPGHKVMNMTKFCMVPVIAWYHHNPGNIVAYWKFQYSSKKTTMQENTQQAQGSLDGNDNGCTSM